MIQCTLFDIPRRSHTEYRPKEFKLTVLRELPVGGQWSLVTEPGKVDAYWREHCQTHPAFVPDVETFWVLLVNTKRHVLGHLLVSTGILDTILVSPREVFRPACIAAAAAIILVHNHPSGDPTPSEADIKTTRDLIRAGEIMKIQVLDHVIVGIPDPIAGRRGYCSLRELGYFS